MVFQASEVRSSAIHGAVHGEAAVSLQHMEVHSGPENHLQPLEDPVQSRSMPKEGCLHGKTHWSRVLTGLMDLWREETMMEQVCCQEL